MSLNVNYTSLYRNGIDNSMLKEVSKEILNRAAQKSSQYTNGLSITQQVNSAAKPVELGLDLYQGKLDTTVQKQIAINNSLQFQLNNETLQSIRFLNSQAAISKVVDGKYIPPVNNAIPTETQKISENNKSQFMSIKTSESSKDKDGSNSFYFGELLMGNNKKNDNQSNNKDKSIFI